MKHREQPPQIRLRSNWVTETKKAKSDSDENQNSRFQLVSFVGLIRSQSLYLSENPQSLSRRVEDYGYGWRGRPMEATAANAERRQQWKLCDEEETREDHGNGRAEAKARPGFRDAFEVAREIEVQFQRASESGNEISKMLKCRAIDFY
ncbi:hypothetical protein EV2_042179 [Malus domestica]